MKKLALLADIHANLEALTACLASAEEAGTECYAFLGDLVGLRHRSGPGGAEPAGGGRRQLRLLLRKSLGARRLRDLS